jgi:ribose-phosphate pyrophosphokinase
VEKRRVGNEDKAVSLNIIGEVAGMRALLFDDEIDTAGSLVEAVKELLQRGASEVYSCCTHPIFSGPAMERIAASPVKEVVVTDTVPVPPEKRLGKTTVLSIAEALGEAIHRIHTGLSVGAMFE